MGGLCYKIAAKAVVSGGRDGSARTEDGQLELKLAVPKQMGGKGDGTNPEELFAAGYAACFIGALKVVAAQVKQKLPDSLRIESQVGLGKVGAGYGINAALAVFLPGMDEAVAQQLVNQAHQVCPYSNATRGNIEVNLSVHV